MDPKTHEKWRFNHWIPRNPLRVKACGFPCSLIIMEKVELFPRNKKKGTYYWRCGTMIMGGRVTTDLIRDVWTKVFDDFFKDMSSNTFTCKAIIFFILYINTCFNLGSKFFSMAHFAGRTRDVSHGSNGCCFSHMSNEKNPGWLDYIGDYTTQLFRDYNKPL